jgi:cadmium resistance protein CadD (predicted permease)
MADKQLKPGRDFWQKANTVKLSWWPDAFILVMVIVFNGILWRFCETYLGSEYIAGGITGLLGVFLGPKWLANIQRRNLQNAPDGEEADADSIDAQDDVPEG